MTLTINLKPETRERLTWVALQVPSRWNVLEVLSYSAREISEMNS
jgi:hypothetical protein